jgi:RNA polymerase sigma-70 factor (ECF subfamily)
MDRQRGTAVARPDTSETDWREFSARLAELFRTYNGTLVGYLAVRLQSQAEAAEIAQEAYLRLLNLSDTGKIIDLKSFLFRTANNIAIDRIRRNHLQRRVLEQAGTAALADAATATSGPGPETHATARQTIELLRVAIEELPPKCRMAFILYKLQGHSYGEIAARMQLTESMVRKYVLRGLQYCRTRLDGQLDH